MPKKTKPSALWKKGKDLKVEDLPVEAVTSLFAGMPCEFTEDDFKKEFARARRKANARASKAS